MEELHYPGAKTKELISFAVTAKLICTFGFAYADCWFSHEEAHLKKWVKNVKHITVNNALKEAP